MSGSTPAKLLALDAVPANATPTISSVRVIPFLIVGNPGISILGTNSSLRETSTYLYELGFTPGLNTSFWTGYESINPIPLSGLRFIDVQVSFGTSSNSKNDMSNILARFYMEYPFGSIDLYRKYVDEDYCVVSAEDLTFIEIRIFDQDGRLVVLPSNQFITYDFIIKALI